MKKIKKLFFGACALLLVSIVLYFFIDNEAGKELIYPYKHRTLKVVGIHESKYASITMLDIDNHKYVYYGSHDKHAGVNVKLGELLRNVSYYQTFNIRRFTKDTMFVDSQLYSNYEYLLPSTDNNQHRRIKLIER